MRSPLREWALVLGGCLVIWGAVFAILAVVAHGRVATWGASSTAYSLCSSGSVMADGTRVRERSVASNRHPLGTKIRLVGAAGPGGLRRWVVRDRIGAHSDLDFWVPTCAAAHRWGRRHVTYRIGWGR